RRRAGRKNPRKGRFFLLRPARASLRSAPTERGGRSSGVEHNLAKVRVVSSNLIARSNGPETAASGPPFCIQAVVFPVRNGARRLCQTSSTARLSSQLPQAVIS